MRHYESVSSVSGVFRAIFIVLALCLTLGASDLRAGFTSSDAPSVQRRNRYERYVQEELERQFLALIHEPGRFDKPEARARAFSEIEAEIANLERRFDELSEVIRARALTVNKETLKLEVFFRAQQIERDSVMLIARAGFVHGFDPVRYRQIMRSVKDSAQEARKNVNHRMVSNLAKGGFWSASALVSGIAALAHVAEPYHLTLGLAAWSVTSTYLGVLDLKKAGWDYVWGSPEDSNIQARYSNKLGQAVRTNPVVRLDRRFLVSPYEVLSILRDVVYSAIPRQSTKKAVSIAGHIGETALSCQEYLLFGEVPPDGLFEAKLNGVINRAYLPNK